METRGASLAFEAVVDGEDEGDDTTGPAMEA